MEQIFPAQNLQWWKGKENDLWARINPRPQEAVWILMKKTCQCQYLNSSVLGNILKKNQVVTTLELLILAKYDTDLLHPQISECQNWKNGNCGILTTERKVHNNALLTW